MRFELEARAQGSFRPNEPITITVDASSNLDGSPAEIAAILLDTDALSEPSTRGTTRQAAAWNADLPAGASRTQSTNITFLKPGYYRVLLRLRPHQPRQSLYNGSLVIEYVDHTLYLLIDDQGGSVYDEPGRAVVGDGRMPFYGSYGPFVDRPTRSQLLRASSAARTSLDRVAGAVGPIFDAYYKYSVEDSASLNYTPVYGGVWSATCYGKSSPDVIIYDLAEERSGYVSQSTGYFSVECPDYRFTYVEGEVRPQGTYIDVKSWDGSGQPVAFSGTTDQGPAELHAYTNKGARVFSVLEYNVPLAVSKFGVSRSKLEARVRSAAPDSSGYCVACGASGQLRYGPTRIFTYTEDGYQVILHEYGHAFHHKAIEWWTSNESLLSCGNHVPDQETDLDCAFVEGFADFFAAWVGGHKLQHHPQALSDSALEVNDEFRDIGNGSIIEGAVAAFLYDLVDVAGDPNGGPSVDDDSMSFPGNYVAGLIATCNTGPNTRVSGIDQFIYCAENSLEAQDSVSPDDDLEYFRERSSSWTTYSESVTEPTGQGWSKARIRRAWKYNLFGEGSLH